MRLVDPVLYSQRSRVVAPATAVVLSSAFFLPLAMALVNADLHVAFKGLVGALLLAAALAPLPTLAALCLLLPLSASMARVYAGHPSVTAIPDGLVVAFLSGATLRGAWRPWAERPALRLAGPAAVLIVAVLASALVELQAIQRVTPRVPLLPELWRYMTTDYWTTAREYPSVHQAIRWTSWLMLAVSAERLVSDSGQRAQAVRIWLLAGAIGAVLTVVFVAAGVLRSSAPIETMRGFVESGRFSALQPDLNAAGSYFALFLLPAVTLAVRRRSWRLAPVVIVLALAFVFTRSRAALGAVVLAFCVASVARIWRASLPGMRPWQKLALGSIVAGTTVAVLGGGAFVATSRSNVAAETALQYRAEMAQVALEAIGRHPIFGVGVGDYIRTTRRFIDAGTPLLQRHAPNGENAHNNYLQIAVELGVLATIAFLSLVGPIAAIAFKVREPFPSPELQGMALGLAVFLASALLGHPLLIPLVGATFFLALGLTAGLMPPVSRPAWARYLLWGTGLFFVMSLTWRLG